jgi:hypothetical protein
LWACLFFTLPAGESGNNDSGGDFDSTRPFAALLCALLQGRASQMMIGSFAVKEARILARRPRFFFATSFTLIRNDQ